MKNMTLVFIISIVCSVLIGMFLESFILNYRTLSKLESDNCNSTDIEKENQSDTITVEMIQKQIDYIIESGYEIKFVEEPLPEDKQYLQFVPVVSFNGEKVDYSCLNNITIYSNNSNEFIYYYLNDMIERINSKKEYLKKLQPNLDIKKLRFNILENKEHFNGFSSSNIENTEEFNTGQIGFDSKYSKVSGVRNIYIGNIEMFKNKENSMK